METRPTDLVPRGVLSSTLLDQRVVWIRDQNRERHWC